MSKPVKDRIADNLDRAKDEGKLRSENIRGLISDATSLTVLELKEGTEQMRSILKNAIFAVIAELKDTSSEIPAKIMTSIEGAVEESTRYRQEAISSLQTKMHDIQAQIEEKQRQIDLDLDDTIVDIKANDINDSRNLDSVIDAAVNNVKQRKESEFIKQQYLNLKFELAHLDKKLLEQYGERYVEVKQQLDSIKGLYDQAKGEAETSGITPIQSKQTEIERQISKFASAIVITEREIVEYLRQLWKNKSFDSHPEDVNQLDR